MGNWTSMYKLYSNRLVQIGFKSVIYLLLKTTKAIIRQQHGAVALFLYLDKLVAEYRARPLTWQVLNLPRLNFLICKVEITVVPSSLIYF